MKFRSGRIWIFFFFLIFYFILPVLAIYESKKGIAYLHYILHSMRFEAKIKTSTKYEQDKEKNLKNFYVNINSSISTLNKYR